jgi:PAP2 superfamily protein
MTIMGLFVSYYTFRHLFSYLYWVLVIGGYWAIISARIHYTADVVLAIMISILVFALFHALADPDWLSGWRSTLSVTMPENNNLELALPLTLTDSLGRSWTVYPEAANEKTVSYLRVGRYSTPDRRALYRAFVHLLGGK